MTDDFDPTPYSDDEISHMADLAADQAIREEGALAPVIDVFAAHLEEEHAKAFEIARRLNRIVMAQWKEATNDGDPYDIGPVTNRLMLRAMNAFAGCVLLARRGMDAEAQTLARSIYECAFWLGYFDSHKDEALALFKLEDERSKAQHTIAAAKMMEATDSDDAKTAEAVVKEANKIRIPGPQTLAIKAGMEPAYVFYKHLCGMAAHSSISSLDRYLSEDEEGRPGHQFNFEGKAIPESLGMACYGLLSAVIRFKRASGVKPVETEALLKISKEFGWMLWQPE